jgi:WG containing repeat
MKTPYFIATLAACWLGVFVGFAQETKPLPAWASRYDTVRRSENVFIVRKNDKMGVVASNGAALTKLAYDTIYNFSEGMAIVGRGHREVNQFGKVLSDFKYGYLNKAGRLVVPMKYQFVNSFSEGWGLIEGINGPYARGYFTFFDKTGKPVLSQETCCCDSFHGNTVSLQVLKQGMWLPPYDDGRDNMGHTQMYNVHGENIYANYIDRQGRLLIPWKYDTIAPYFSGYLRPVRKNGKWGFLDSLANVAIALQYDDIDADSAFFWQNLRRVGIAGKYGFMNPRTGQLAVPLQYSASKPSQSGLVWVQQGGRWGCLNTAGRVVIPFRYADARPFEGGLSVVQLVDKQGIINTSGRVVAPIKYDTILAFQENRAIVRRGALFGFVDETGHEIIPTDYSKVSSFSNGKAFARRWGLFITLNPAGDWVAVKLQPITLKILVGVFVAFIVAGLAWWNYRTRLLRNGYQFQPEG